MIRLILCEKVGKKKPVLASPEPGFHLAEVKASHLFEFIAAPTVLFSRRRRFHSFFSKPCTLSNLARTSAHQQGCGRNVLSLITRARPPAAGETHLAT